MITKDTAAIIGGGIRTLGKPIHKYWKAWESMIPDPS